jgi:hypothetical protein
VRSALKVDLRTDEARLVFEGLLHVRELLAGAVERAEAEGLRDTREHRDLAELEELLRRMRQRATSDPVFEAAWQHFLSRRREH